MRNAHGTPWRNVPDDIKQHAQAIMKEHGYGHSWAKYGWSIYHSPTTRRPLTVYILRYRTIEGVLYEWDLLNQP